jgi:hypothetical protein
MSDEGFGNSWAGWVRSRRGEPWQLVCHGRTIRECHVRLLKARPEAKSVNRFLTAGNYPMESSR